MPRTGHTPTATGNYAVVVTQDGCTATSTCVFVQVVSTNEPLDGQAWALQPSPASSQAQIVWLESTDENLWLEIRDLAGRLLYSRDVASGTRILDLNLSGLPDGMLVVRLANEKTVSSKRLVKAAK